MQGTASSLGMPNSTVETYTCRFCRPFLGTMFLIVVDAHSKWPKVFIKRTTMAERTVYCIHKLFCWFGIQKMAVSDNGLQLVSEEFKVFMSAIGARHLSAPYCPSTNGLAEHFVQPLKSPLRKSSPVAPLGEALQHFLLAYRNTPHSTAGETPANLLMGRRLHTRIDFIKPSAEGRVMHKQFTQRIRQKIIRDGFCVNDSVLVRNYRGLPKWVHGTVLKMTGAVSY